MWSSLSCIVRHYRLLPSLPPRGQGVCSLTDPQIRMWMSLLAEDVHDGHWGKVQGTSFFPSELKKKEKGKENTKGCSFFPWTHLDIKGWKLTCTVQAHTLPRPTINYYMCLYCMADVLTIMLWWKKSSRTLQLRTNECWNTVLSARYKGWGRVWGASVYHRVLISLPLQL